MTTKDSTLFQDSLHCQLCRLKLDSFTIPEREKHYQRHFNDEDEIIKINSLQDQMSPSHGFRNTDLSASQLGKKSKVQKWGHKLVRSGNRERDIFWYPMLTCPPPSSYTPCLIPIIKGALLKLHTRGTLSRAVLCYERAVHIHTECWDAHWGCGYRNFLMLCASLMDQKMQPMYFSLLDAPIPPSVRNLQRWIESAWEAGYDEEGAKQLKHLSNTRKWIGTADLWVALRFRGVPAELVDFNLESQGTERLIKWIVNYFSPKETATQLRSIHDALGGASPVTVTEKMPLILQHKGHSRTIIGYEIDKRGVVSLLTFDPAKKVDGEVKKAALKLLTAQNLDDNLDINLSTNAINSGNLSSLPTRTITRQSLEIDPADVKHLADKRPKLHPSSSIELTLGDKNIFPPSTTPLIHPQVVEDEEAIYIGTSIPIVSDNRSKRKRVDLDCRINTQILLKDLRITPKMLAKHSEYQILYCPMSAHLTENERLRIKSVVSTKIC